MQIGDAARDKAVFIDQLRMMDALTGEELVNLPLDEPFRKRFGNPYAVVHRGDLHKTLLEACQAQGNVSLHANSQVQKYDQDGSGVRVTLANGESHEGSALVGADGLWSAVRTQVAGDSKPRVSGHTSFRSVIPTEQMPEELRWNAATLWAGPRVHLVHYPLSDWKVFNLVITCHNDAPEPVAGKPVSHDEVRQYFTHIHPMAQQIIEHGQDWKYWVLCDRDPIENWVDGRVALLGDAAHPMLQYYAQGACMAMEDAVCLAHEVERFSGDIEKAFPSYLDKRLVRTTRVQVGSRVVGEHIYHPDGAHAKTRNAILRSLSTEDMHDRMGWLYGWTIDSRL